FPGPIAHRHRLRLKDLCHKGLGRAFSGAEKTGSPVCSARRSLAPPFMDVPNLDDLISLKGRSDRLLCLRALVQPHCGTPSQAQRGRWAEVVAPLGKNEEISKRRLMRLLVDQQEALALLCECVNIKTANPPGDEARLTDVLVERLGAAGLAVDTHILAPGRANLLARLPGTGERPALILSGHTDTVGPGAVPWQNDPWSGRIVGDRLYGLGACDMKSGLAAMAMAMILLRRASVRLRGDLVLAASAGEEVDGLGALAFVASGAVSGAGAMVVGEPTGGEVAVAHKGGALLVF